MSVFQYQSNKIKIESKLNQNFLKSKSFDYIGSKYVRKTIPQYKSFV